MNETLEFAEPIGPPIEPAWWALNGGVETAFFVVALIFIGAITVPQLINWAVFRYIDWQNIIRMSDGVLKIRAAVCFFTEERVARTPKYKDLIILIKRPEGWDQRQYIRWCGERCHFWADRDDARGDDINMPAIMQGFGWKVEYVEFSADRYFWAWCIPGNRLGWARQLLRVNHAGIWSVARLHTWCQSNSTNWPASRSAAGPSDPRVQKHAFDRGLMAPMGMTKATMSGNGVERPAADKPASEQAEEPSGNVVPMEQPEWQKAIPSKRDEDEQMPAE